MLIAKIDDLKRQIIQYSAHVEKMIEKSIRGLVLQNEDLLNSVIKKDENKANILELELDRTCTTLIAQYQPMGKDLRTVLMIYDMSNAFERMGDHAVNISESALPLIKHEKIKPFIDIPRMSEITIKMLNDCIEAFVNESSKIAKEVCKRDSMINGIRAQILRELITFMAENPSIISDCLHILRIADNLERIADLTTNICEDVIFIKKGKVAKHNKQKNN